MGKCKNCGISWWKHSPSEEIWCQKIIDQPCIGDPCAPGINRCDIHDWDGFTLIEHKPSRWEAWGNRPYYLLFYYSVVMSVVPVMTRFLFKKMDAYHHITGFTMVDWMMTTFVIASFILLVSYLLNRVWRQE
jgi:hypothetical protein